MFEGKFFIRLVFTKIWYKKNVGYSYNDTTPPDNYIREENEEDMIYSNFGDDFDYEGYYSLFDDWLTYGGDLVDWDVNTQFEVKLDDYEDTIDDFCDSVYEYLEENEIKDKELREKVENFHQIATNVSFWNKKEFYKELDALHDAYYDFVKIAKEKNIIAN